MTGIFDENIAKVIKQNDPDIPKYLDFDKLRNEGLEHIGRLSGKIWTDHNVHDPGITILEVLIYALMDLGYKTNLPFRDLITQSNGDQDEDNFLTSLQILTVNPVTLLDYRKLLLECPGVRNAWIEPAQQELELTVIPRTNTLNCGGQLPRQIPDCNGNPIHANVELNGLYKIYIEKEEGFELTKEDFENEFKDCCLPRCDINNTEAEPGKDFYFKEKIRALWSGYRNLCEDLIDVTILEPLDIGVCAQVEILAGFEPSKVYKDVLIAIREFIQPQVRYYTLDELLDKGKSIDEIFAGRPYRSESYGFVDTMEFEALERRVSLNLSDLYDVILSIDGIRKIKRIQIDGGQLINKPSEKWVEGNKIGDLQVPVFSLDKICVDLYSAEGLISIEKGKIHGTLPVLKKFRLPLSNLDTSVPSGNYREDLSRYYSIQNDFPVVYGIGEDGLPDNASLTRKTQALQLKGYLMFYDQLLANYTSQLSHIRSLFSLKPEAARNPDEKHTYFIQITDTIPGLEKLLKFYNKDPDIANGTELALPVANDENWLQALAQLETDGRAILSIGNYCDNKEALVPLYTFSSATVRSIYINQLQNTFDNEGYEINVHQDRYGYFFVLYPCLPNDIAMVGTKRFKKYEEAIIEARNVAFIASIPGNYNLVTDKSEDSNPDQHYFGLNCNVLSYLELIQGIAEDGVEYSHRRKRMLDHLLARFGEDFTDYTLLQYRLGFSQNELDQKTLIDESAYLNEFAEISRNRGKAFDYLQPSWNSTNVSGFEKRVTLLAGLNNYKRRHLCNIEVVPCFRMQLKDEKGNQLLKGRRSYDSMEAFKKSVHQLLAQLQNPSEYGQLERKVSSANTYALARIFSRQPEDDQIIIAEYEHEQQLRDTNNDVVVTGKKTRFKTPEAAQKERDGFIKNTSQHSIQKPKENKKPYHFLPIAGKEQYLDVNAFDVNIIKHPYWKWNVTGLGPGEKTVSESVFGSEEEAWNDAWENSQLDPYITEFEEAVSWNVVVNNVVTLVSKRLYTDAGRAKSAWENARDSAKTPDNFSFDKFDEDTFRIFLTNDKEVVAVSEEISLDVFDPESTIRVCVEAFSNEALLPGFTPLNTAYGFRVPGQNSFPTLESYHRYSSPKQAIEEMQKVYTLGMSKRNYSQSGDEASASPSFRLQLDAAVTLAKPLSTYETDKDRTRALNASIRFFKKNEPPVSLKRQPNKYTWSLADDFRDMVRSDEEFSSGAKARDDFEKSFIAAASNADDQRFDAHSYLFNIETRPSKYKFLYGSADTENEFKPLFISKAAYASEDGAKNAYAKFVRQLPQLSFKVIDGENEPYNFALYKDTGEDATPVAVQYRQDSQKAATDEAQAVVNYIQSMYGPDLKPRDEFIEAEMLENKDGLYQWKFYKKNDPLAVNPYCCLEKNSTEQIREAICELIPPIDLNYCPPKDIITCPEKDPDRYHYQICFKNKNGLEFNLISFMGYSSYEEALEAWEKEWYDLLLLAKNPMEYGPGGKINLEEDYRQAEEKGCEDASYLAVIPAENKRKVLEAGETVLTFYTRMARVFPIYEVEKEGKPAYQFKVVITEEVAVPGDCNAMMSNTPEEEYGTLIWLGTDCYACYADAIKAYNHFYILTGIPQNCRILCEKGRYYVGLVEVLVESFCRYASESEAWDDAFATYGDNNLPYASDACGDCLPGGVRSFLYASDELQNFIPVCIDGDWTFKVVTADYFVAAHTCTYNSEAERDQKLEKWKSTLEGLNWEKYLQLELADDTETTDMVFSSLFLDSLAVTDPDKDRIERICTLVFTIRECLQDCSGNNVSNAKLLPILKKCLLEKYKEDIWVLGFIKNLDEKGLEEVKRFVSYYPIYTTDNGACYRIYWPENDREISEGLQPCGCEEAEIAENSTACGAKYPFESSICYACCEEAVRAFGYLAGLMRDGRYTVECTQAGDFGPYSFQIVDSSRELGYHPQRYDSYQDVLDAIRLTQSCAIDVGMHLLEHILLRPKTTAECMELGGMGNYDGGAEENCLLPICPDYCCPIDWYPDMDKDDPCAKEDPDVIYYLPGSDPYSFWATLALPSWAKRFRTQDARRAYEQVLYKEVPALVGLNILWLSPRDMCRFEYKFRLWLDWLQNPEEKVCDPDGKHPSCRIAECIRDLKSEPACHTIPGAGGECKCGEDAVRDINACCLPPETEGTIFWGHCPPEPYQPVPDDPVLLLSESMEIADVDSRAKKSVKISKTKKSTPEDGLRRARLLAQIRKRKPRYLDTVEGLADDSLKQTKSYERTVFFLSNNPTVSGFVNLVDFFNRYSLRTANTMETYLQFLQNATWHLLDKLVLELEGGIPEKEWAGLQDGISILMEKGVKNRELYVGWKRDDLGELAHAVPLKQIKELFKVKNG